LRTSEARGEQLLQDHAPDRGRVAVQLADVLPDDLLGSLAQLCRGGGIAVHDPPLEIDDVDSLGRPFDCGGEQAQPLLPLGTLADVGQQRAGPEGAPARHRGHRDFHREKFAAFAPAAADRPAPDERALARGLPGAVLGKQRLLFFGGEQEGERSAAHRLVAAIAEDDGRRGVPVADDPLVVDHYDAAHGRVRDRGEHLPALAQLGVRLRALAALERETLVVAHQLVPQRDLAHQHPLMKPADQDACGENAEEQHGVDGEIPGFEHGVPQEERDNIDHEKGALAQGREPRPGRDQPRHDD
jgi:hypothetical protein